MSNIISAAAMRCKTMADGSLRIEVEVEPVDAQAAFALFGKPGAPMALAALVQGYASKADTEPSEDEKNSAMRAAVEAMPMAKGGALCRLAAQWCQSPAFQEWANRTFPNLVGAVYAASVSDDPAEIMAEVIRQHCGIASRAELDHNHAAATQFHKSFREPFNAWMTRNA